MIKENIKKNKPAITAGIITIIALCLFKLFDSPLLNKEYLVKKIDVEMVKDENRDKRIESVSRYIEKALRNQKFDINNLLLSPEAIVDVCDKNEFDLPLLLAQAHLESCFGMTKRARRTNSVWSVGLFDDGTDHCSYSEQNDSIEPYIRLMKNNYLKNKTIDELLKPGNFVNTKGKRYATDASYESKVKSIRNKIIRDYPDLV